MALYFTLVEYHNNILNKTNLSLVHFSFIQLFINFKRALLWSSMSKLMTLFVEIKPFF